MQYHHITIVSSLLNIKPKKLKTSLLVKKPINSLVRVQEYSEFTELIIGSQIQILFFGNAHVKTNKCQPTTNAFE